MISFIIPAYNSSKTIKKVIDSILNQAHNDLEYEIIVVDDGSTDNLRDVLKEYSPSELKYVNYYRKENGGLSSARNFGFKKSRGDYIIFVDGDDYVSKKLLKDIEPYIKKGYDLIKWNPAIVNMKEEKIEDVEIDELQEGTGEDCFNKLYGKDKLMSCVWNYAIRRDLVPEFPEGMYHEDFATMPFVILNAKRMIVTNKIEYYYVQSSSSITRGNNKNKQKKRLVDILKHFDNIVKSADELKVSDYTKENLKIYAANALLVNVNDLTGDNKKYFIKELKKRKIAKYLKPRTFKQFLRKVIVEILY